MINVVSFQALPNVRDYQMNSAVMEYDPEIRISVLAEMPGYFDAFENLGYPFVTSPRFWRSKPRNLVAKLWYHFFDERFSGPRLRGIVKQMEADVIHSHNLNRLGYYAIRYTDLPVIHDVSDFYSIFPRNQEVPSNQSMGPWERYKHRRELKWERFVFENTAGLTFQSPYYREIAKERYRIQGETAVIPNVVLADDLPRRDLPKLSDEDGQVHTVFVGHVNRLKLDRIKEIADRGVPVHLYPLQEPEFESTLLAECRTHNYLHNHGTLPRREILDALTQYDFGLVLWYRGATEPFFDAVLPNKMFYYLASGVPLIVAPYRSLVEFVSARGCGFVLNYIDELEDKIQQEHSVGDRSQYTVEHYIPELAKLYRRLV